MIREYFLRHLTFTFMMSCYGADCTFFAAHRCSAGKRHVIKGSGHISLPHLIRPRFAQVKHTLFARIKPISKAFKWRTLPLGEPHDLTVKLLELIEQLTRGAQVVMIK